MVKKRIKRRSSGSGRAGMLRQIQALQEDLMRAQDEIVAMKTTVSVGGGAVTVTVTGDKRLQSITIAPEVVDPEDVEMLQDLIVAAVNEGFEQLDKEASEKMSAITGGLGGLGIPGLT